MRDLASVVTIATKNKMFEKDRICVVSFKELGYEAIVPIEHNVGDRMVFIQEGSILPEEEKWEFLRKRCYKEDLKGFLIKPMTMGARDVNGERGDRVKSWGLCVSLSEAGLSEDLKAGTDVTDKLKIRKYEPAEDASPTPSKTPEFIKFCYKHRLLKWIAKWWKATHTTPKGKFPTDIIAQSDETTIQNYTRVIENFPGKKAFITAKMEGQSFTCSLDKKGKFFICSRTRRLSSGDSNGKDFFAGAKKYDIAAKLKDYLKKTGVTLVIQGEQCGPRIQGNIYNFPDIHWFVFRMKGKEAGEWKEYNYPKMKEVADQLGLECVPLLEVVDDMSKYNSIKSLVERAERASWTEFDFNYIPRSTDKLWKNYSQHEGIVVKSEDYDKEKGTGFSFKVKNLAYAEKTYGEMAEIANTIAKNLIKETVKHGDCTVPH